MILEGMNGDSRVWQFAANRALLEEEEMQLRVELQSFVAQWQAHGKDLTAAADVFHAGVVLVAIDEHAALPSGCSIDKIFRLLQQWGVEKNVDFFNRLIVTVPFCNSCKVFDQSQAKASLESGNLKAEHLVVDAMLQNLDGIRNNWYLPFSQSWMGKKINL